MKKLRLKDSFLVYADVLVARPDTFTTTTGNLWGVSGFYLPYDHKLPSLYEDAYVACNPEYTVLSYDTPIAWRVDGVWISPDIKYSVSTSRHQNKIRTEIGVISK